MERTALTIGTFDLTHAGHAHLFRECERLGRVVVGINSDEFVESYKGQRPLYEYAKREQLIRALGYETIMNTSAGRDCIEAVKPDYLVIGSDWARRNYYSQIDVDQDFMDENGISMVYVPRIGTISSSEIKSLTNQQEATGAWRTHHAG